MTFQVPGRAPVPRVRAERGPIPFNRSTGGTAEEAIGAAAQDLGEAINFAGDVAGNIGLQQQIEDNEREAKRLDVEFSSAIRTLGYGDGTDQNTGFYSTNGEVTVNDAPAIKQAIEEERRRLIESAPNQRVKQIFGDASRARQEDEFGSIDRFTLKQRNIANDTTSEARIAQANSDAAANPANIARSIAIARSETLDMADRNGWSGEVAAFKLKQAETAIYQSAITAAVKRDEVMVAQNLYDTTKGKMEAGVRAELKQTLDAAMLTGKSQQVTDSIMALNLNETQSLERARAITNAKLRDEVVTRVTRRFEQAHNARTRTEAEKRLALPSASIEAADAIKYTSVSESEALAAAEEILDPQLRDATTKRLKDYYANQRRIDAEVLVDNSRITADRIVQTAPGEEEALAAARAIEDTKLRDATITRVTEYYAADRAIADEKIRRVSQRVMDEIAAAGATEQQANEIVSRIDDPKIRDAAQARVRSYYDTQKRIEDEALREQSQRAADQLPADEEGLQAAREIEDAKLRDATVTRLNQRITEGKRAEKASKDKAFADAYSAVWRGVKISDWARQNPEAFNLISSDVAFNGLQAAEAKVSEGQLFASATDGKTLPAIRQMETQDLANLNLDSVRARLTETEFGQASILVAGAKARVSRTQENQEIFTRGQTLIREFAPSFLKKQWGTNKENPDNAKLRREAINAMDGFIQQFLDRGEVPTREDLVAEASRIMTPIQADFYPWIPFTGTETIVADLQALTPEQRAIVTVDEDDIPNDLLAQIKSTLQAAGLDPNNTALIESLAGARVTNNVARARRILGQPPPVAETRVQE